MAAGGKQCRERTAGCSSSRQLCSACRWSEAQQAKIQQGLEVTRARHEGEVRIDCLPPCSCPRRGEGPSQMREVVVLWKCDKFSQSSIVELRRRVRDGIPPTAEVVSRLSLAIALAERAQRRPAILVECGVQAARLILALHLPF